MTDENELEYIDITDEQLADYHLKEAIEHAQLTLQMAERCYQKFGKQLLSDTQKNFFEKVASGVLPNDDEHIDVGIEMANQAREADKQKSVELGETYVPTLTFEDKTEGFALN